MGDFPFLSPLANACLTIRYRDLLDHEKLCKTEQETIEAWLNKCEEFKDITYGSYAMVLYYYTYFGKKLISPEEDEHLTVYNDILRSLLSLHNIEMTEENKEIFKYYIQ